MAKVKLAVVEGELRLPSPGFCEVSNSDPPCLPDWEVLSIISRTVAITARRQLVTTTTMTVQLELIKVPHELRLYLGIA